VVQITGEAYFEVAKNAAQPFMVYFSSPADGGREGAVEVLGTHFNVNAYADENKIKVTLLEGLIKVQSSLASGESEIVHPGQQIQMNEKGAMNLVRDADVDGEVSWKNGFFSFRNDNLVEVMKKLSRWYDVDVTYQPGIDNRQQFTGRIDRNLTLSQVLKGLELTNAHFKIEANRKLEILP
ncbi:MAG: FecR family protein, partial [Chitinophagaceae bacterium]